MPLAPDTNESCWISTCTTVFYAISNTCFRWPNCDRRLTYKLPILQVYLCKCRLFYGLCYRKSAKISCSQSCAYKCRRLVEVIVSPDGSTWAGELLDIISIEQTSDLMYSLGHFRWFRPWRGTLTDTVWNVLVSGVHFDRNYTMITNAARRLA